MFVQIDNIKHNFDTNFTIAMYLYTLIKNNKFSSEELIFYWLNTNRQRNVRTKRLLDSVFWEAVGKNGVPLSWLWKKLESENLIKSVRPKLPKILFTNRFLMVQRLVEKSHLVRGNDISDKVIIFLRDNTDDDQRLTEAVEWQNVVAFTFTNGWSSSPSVAPYLFWFSLPKTLDSENAYESCGKNNICWCTRRSNVFCYYYVTWPV